ncbi:MAG: crossover junction endodeoxyribonuclease RuvC [Clostridia bacterium]|nr:crossover junction endodeoxyribonuclease RuvC [Clostridia bacterium]
MIILGIDPGLAIMGYGIIEINGNRVRTIDYGAIYTPSHTPVSSRLQMIYDGLNQLFKKFKPDKVAFEELFFNTNTTTAINVAQARGIAILVANQNCNEIYEFTPLQIKQALTGNGRAEKKQVQYMVKQILNLRELPKPDDAGDALAVAICLSQTNTQIRNFKM